MSRLVQTLSIFVVGIASLLIRWLKTLMLILAITGLLIVGGFGFMIFCGIFGLMVLTLTLFWLLGHLSLGIIAFVLLAIVLGGTMVRKLREILRRILKPKRGFYLALRIGEKPLPKSLKSIAHQTGKTGSKTSRKSKKMLDLTGGGW